MKRQAKKTLNSDSPNFVGVAAEFVKFNVSFYNAHAYIFPSNKQAFYRILFVSSFVMFEQVKS